MKINGREYPYQYCIQCERMTPVWGIDYPHHILAYTYRDSGPEEEICEGPFASCLPPEMTEEAWDAIFADEVRNDQG